MKIGKTTVDLQDRPDDLDARLIAATGCDASEIAGMLAGNPIAGLVANALLPFLGEGSAPELAALIDGAGTPAIAAQVLALYATEQRDAEDDA